MSGWIERMPICLTPLSPIHIGHGSEIDWTVSYLDGNELVQFDPLRLELPEPLLGGIDKAAAMPDGGKALLALQRLYTANKRLLAPGRTGSISVPAGLAAKIAGTVGRPAQIEADGGAVVNSLSVARTAFSALTGQAYVPGSSLKGALRTAWLDGLPQKRRPGGPGQTRLLEDEMLGGRFASDPFRLIQVEDSIGPRPARTLIVQARNVKRAADRPGKGLPLRVEAIGPYQAGAFVGGLRRRDLGGRRIRERGDDAAPVAAQVPELATACTRFHLRLFQSEAAQQRSLRAVDRGWLDAVDSLLRGPLARALRDGSAALVRIGKFGGAESKTVEGREIKIRVSGTRHEHRAAGTTFWLAGDHEAERALPFGWAVLELAGEPGPAVQAWCRWMTERFELLCAPAPPPFQRGEDSERPVQDRPGDRIVEDPQSDPERMLSSLEDLLDAGRQVDAMIANYVNQARTWDPKERALLVRIVREKGLAQSRLAPFKRRELEEKLKKLAP
ncbi:MAG TPA: RAMP superfamily CRISPR-associated protein [Dongiaceae bacterium]|nr:RAMP superfamily CRISPR-associated protein [Dongiaceae bacterium]